MVEPQIVILVVAGSSPVRHPIPFLYKKSTYGALFYYPQPFLHA